MLTLIRDDNNNPIKIEVVPFRGDRKSISQLKLVVEEIKPVRVIKLFLQGICKDFSFREVEEIEEEYAKLLNENTKEITEEDNTIEVLDLSNPTDQILEMENEYPFLKEIRETGEYTYVPEPKLPEDSPVLVSLLIKYCKLWAKKKIASIVLNKPESEISKDDMERAIIKQINYQSYESSLVLKKLNGETLTEEEEEYLTTLTNLRENINQIRFKSNEVENLILESKTLDDLMSALDQLE